MDIELGHLRTLAEIARQRSFSRAADHLHLSQPAVSHHVRHLEAAAGVPLLERLGKRAVPTSAGELLLEHARRVFRELEAAAQGIQRLQGMVSGRVRVGTGATASIYLLPRLFRQLRRGHPEIELVVVTGNAPDIVAGVLRSELDVGIVTLPVPERRLQVSTFASDPLVAIVPPGAEWRGRKAVSAAEVARYPLIVYETGGLIRKVIDGWFRAARTRPRIAMELGNAEAIKELVSAGLGISIGSAITVPADVRRGRLLAIPLTPPLQRDLGIIHRRAGTMTPAVSVVVAALKAFAGAARAESERRLRRRNPGSSGGGGGGGRRGPLR